MIKVSIKGDAWKIYVFDHDEYVSKFGEGTSGFTDTKRRQVFFSADDLDLELVRHELFHCYASYLYHDAVELTQDQIEEIYAEMFSKEGTKMIQKATDIFNKLRGME